MEERGEGLPGPFHRQGNRKDASALVQKEEDRGRRGAITLQAEETVPNHATDFFYDNGFEREFI